MRVCGSCGVYFMDIRSAEAHVHNYYRPESYTPYAKDLGPQENHAPYSCRLFGNWFQSRTAMSMWWAIECMTAPLLEWPNAWLRHRLDRAVDHAYRERGAGTRFLDYGCGTSSWLRKAKEYGWNAHGVDFSPNVVKALRAEGFGASLAKDWLAGEEHMEYELVRLNHVLEHFYDPEVVLRKIFERLAPGGLLHIATPNPMSWVRTVFGRHWWGFEYPRHITLFPPAALRKLLKSLGFSNIQIISNPVQKDFIRSLGSWLASQGRLPREQVVHIRYDAFYSRIVALPAALMSLVHRSDQYSVLATR
jgi:SAM-dependent methyltransferase